MAVDFESLQKASIRLSDVVADSSCWTDLLDEVAIATGAMGAALIPQTGSEGALATASMKECLEAYVGEGWCDEDRDTRRRARDLLMRGEVALDRDLVGADDQHAPFFDDFLPRFDGRWWAGIGVRCGPDFWSLTLHRSAHQGSFQQAERAILRQFAWRLNEVGALTYVAGRVTLSVVAKSFDQVGMAVVAIDETGKVIHANGAAEHLFGETIRVVGGRLTFRDRKAAAEYTNIVDRLNATAEGRTLRAAPVFVRRGENAAPLVIRVLALDGAARSPFLHARALLLLKEIRRPELSDWQDFSSALGLTPAEARLAAHLGTGESLERTAELLGITKETARTRAKSVFQKVDVHRQAELVALLNSMHS